MNSERDQCRETIAIRCETASDACYCMTCAVCYGRTICEYCGQCARCHQHYPGCRGCHVMSDDMTEIAAVACQMGTHMRSVNGQRGDTLHRASVRVADGRVLTVTWEWTDDETQT